MANDNETVREVCAEMRGMGNYQSFSGDHAHELANRIESSHEREMAANDAEIKNLRDINSKLRDNLLEEMASIAAKDDEIEKIKLDFITLSNTFNRTVVNPQFRILELEKKVALLERALKPVMECNEEACRSFGDHYLMLDNAVRDAQRVMREGGTE